MPTAARPSSAAERQKRLLIAADDLFASTPYGEVSIDAVADRARVAHGLAFHYFGSKRGLYLAAVAYGNEVRQLRFEQNAQRDPARWLLAEIDALLDVAAAAPQTFLRLLRNDSGADVGELLKAARLREVERVIEKIAPDRTSSMLYAVVSSWVAYANEMVARWLEGDGGTHRQIKRVLIELLNGSLSSLAATERKPGFDPDVFANASSMVHG